MSEADPLGLFSIVLYQDIADDAKWKRSLFCLVEGTIRLVEGAMAPCPWITTFQSMIRQN